MLPARLEAGVAGRAARCSGGCAAACSDFSLRACAGDGACRQNARCWTRGATRPTRVHAQFTVGAVAQMLPQAQVAMQAHLIVRLDLGALQAGVLQEGVLACRSCRRGHTKGTRRWLGLVWSRAESMVTMQEAGAPVRPEFKPAYTHACLLAGAAGCSPAAKSMCGPRTPSSFATPGPCTSSTLASSPSATRWAWTGSPAVQETRVICVSDRRCTWDATWDLEREKGGGVIQHVWPTLPLMGRAWSFASCTHAHPAFLLHAAPQEPCLPPLDGTEKGAEGSTWAH